MDIYSLLITRKNFMPRIRLGVGQLSEYRYRRQIQTHLTPNSVLVLSNTLQLPDWTLDYLTSDIRIGLLYFTTNSFFAVTKGSIRHLQKLGFHLDRIRV